MPQSQSTTPTHVGGCPCEACADERATFERCLAVLEEAREISAAVAAR